jgi:hypothetical protein
VTTYTTPHSLPILETTDKIAASTDGLLQDINAVSTAANTAITAEGSRAEAAAKAYADTKVATNQSAWVAGDTATLASAKSYSDDQNQAYRVVDWAKFREEDAANLAAAKTYADTKDGTNLTAAKAYTDGVANSYRTTDRALWRTEDDGHQAAAEANAKAYADGKFVPSGDQRLLKLEDMDELSFGVEDAVGRRLWLEANKAGKPTTYSSGLIGEAIGYQTVPVDGGAGFAVVDAQDRIVFAPNRSHPVADWAHWGDSMTDDEVTGTDSWTVQMSALTGRNHFNGGWYQQKSDQIAARMGALPALVTLSGNATAASGGSTVTAITNSPVLYSNTRYVRGTLAGIPGSLQQTYTEIVLFYPDVPGVFPVPPRTPFIPADGLALRDRHVTIWTGRNDVYSTDPQLVVAAVQQMLEYVSTDVKRVLVFEVPPSTADGGSGKPLTLAINTALKAAVPAYWLPICSWLRTPEAATAAGITFTAQDNTDIANGDTPSSFRMDSVHLNATGCKAVAFRVHQEAQKRGWL